MIDWIETCLFGAALIFLLCGLMPRWRAYRALLLGGFVLMLSTALFRRRDSLLGKYLFTGATGTVHLPAELFGIAWWILGAWLVRSLLTLVLRRTLFPNDDRPHARRLFADLASGFVYVVALVGIMDTVLKQPVSTVLATSGVIAIVLGLALQNTLADVFSGIAINIERSFGAGDWITLPGQAEGQVIEINWRATRIRTSCNDIVVIPNSIIAKAVVTNHRRLDSPHLCAFRINVDCSVPPRRVIDTLQAAANSSPGIAPGAACVASACGLADSLVAYEICFGVDDFALAPTIQSEVIRRVVDAFQAGGIAIGAAATDVRIVGAGSSEMVKSACGNACNRAMDIGSPLASEKP